jgi:hypothetical protein
LKSRLRGLVGKSEAPVVDRTVRIERRGVEVEATYQVAYNNLRPIHRPVYRSLRLPRDFYERRRHIFEASPPVTNHDWVSYWLYAQLLDRIPKSVVTVAEFGVWRGAFLENLAIHAEQTGKKLVVHGFDMFDDFPDIAEPIDLRSRPRTDYAAAIGSNAPASAAAIRRRLAPYTSVSELNLVAGDITKATPQPMALDFVHFDMDFYAAFNAAMAWIHNPGAGVLAIDDYYQPSWVGIVDAVNDFSAKHRLYPVNLSDYFRIERSLRTQWIALLLPLREIA